MKRLARALHLAAEQGEKRLDQGGQPYFLHCLRVMQGTNSKDEDILCAAVLHDYIEDADDPAEAREFLRLGGSRAQSHRTMQLLEVLTRTPDMDYDTYIKRIATDRNATLIKLADLRDNCDVTRLKGLRKKDFDRTEKYHRAYIYLSGAH